MAIDVAAIQESLKAEGLDGWLLYDFHGSNPIAARLVGTNNGAKMTTRRWFYLIPATGEPRGLVHAIERKTLDALPGDESRVCRAAAARCGADETVERHEARGHGVFARVRDSVYLAHRRRHDRAGARTRRRGGIVGRSRAAVRGGVGRAGARHASRGVGGALSREGSRVRSRREARARRRGDDGICGPAADGGVVRGRRVDQRLAPGRRGAGKRGRSALPADGAPHDGRLARTSWCCWTCGRRRKKTRRRSTPILRG